MVAGRAFASTIAAGLAFAFCAVAQNPTAIVESEGEAKVAVAPDEIRFEFKKSFNGPTLTDSASQAAAFEKALTQALGDLDAAPLKQGPLQLSVPDAGHQTIDGKVRVSYGVPTANAAPGAAPRTPLVELVERIRKAGVSLMAETAFAGFDVSDRETPEHDVIARASENALYHAEAVGELLEGRVLGVDRIEIAETGWKGLDTKDGLSIPPVAECFARVRISYRYSTSVR